MGMRVFEVGESVGLYEYTLGNDGVKEEGVRDGSVVGLYDGSCVGCIVGVFDRIVEVGERVEVVGGMDVIVGELWECVGYRELLVLVVGAGEGKSELRNEGIWEGNAELSVGVNEVDVEDGKSEEWLGDREGIEDMDSGMEDGRRVDSNDGTCDGRMVELEVGSSVGVRDTGCNVEGLGEGLHVGLALDTEGL